MPDFLNLNELSCNELRDIVSHAINSKKGMRPAPIENAIKRAHCTKQNEGGCTAGKARQCHSFGGLFYTVKDR